MGTRIELIAKRQDDLHGAKPDYHVYAGTQLVGRIYQTHLTGAVDNWFWGVNGLTVDATVGAVMQGNAGGIDDAKQKIRAAFERWLTWALTMPSTDLKYPLLMAELKRMKPE